MPIKMKDVAAGAAVKYGGCTCIVANEDSGKPLLSEGYMLAMIIDPDDKRGNLISIHSENEVEKVEFNFMTASLPQS